MLETKDRVLPSQPRGNSQFWRARRCHFHFNPESHLDVLRNLPAVARRVLKRRDALPPRLRLRPEENLDALVPEPRDLGVDVGHPHRQLAAVAGVAPGDGGLADELPGGAAEQQIQNDIVEAHRARLGIFEEHRGAKHARVKVLGRGEVLGEEGDGGDGAEGVGVGHLGGFWILSKWDEMVCGADIATRKSAVWDGFYRLATPQWVRSVLTRLELSAQVGVGEAVLCWVGGLGASAWASEASSRCLHRHSTLQQGGCVKRCLGHLFPTFHDSM